MTVTIDIPGLRLISEANAREHWRVRHKRKKEQQYVVDLHLLASKRRFKGLKTPLKVTLTRQGKRRMDSDNLAGCFKHAQDALAKFMGFDDGDYEKVTWQYRQEPGRDYGLRIELEAA